MIQKSSQPPPFWATSAGCVAKNGAGGVHLLGSPGSSAVEYIGGPAWNTRYHLLWGRK